MASSDSFIMQQQRHLQHDVIQGWSSTSCIEFCCWHR